MRAWNNEKNKKMLAWSNEEILTGVKENIKQTTELAGY